MEPLEHTTIVFDILRDGNFVGLNVGPKTKAAIWRLIKWLISTTIEFFEAPACKNWL